MRAVFIEIKSFEKAQMLLNKILDGFRNILKWIRKGLEFLIRNPGILISLLALSVAANNNRISATKSRLDNLYTRSIDYVINLEKSELILAYRPERTLATKQEEIEIKNKTDAISQLIDQSINNENKYAKRLKNSLYSVNANHRLEIERLTKSYAKSVITDKKEISKLENELQYIEKNKDEFQNAYSNFKDILVKYYVEEEKNNIFKLLYFF